MLPPALRACLRASLGAAAIVASAVLPAAAVDETWPMAGRDPAHSASADGPQPPYSVAWTRPVGSGGPVTGVAVSDEAAVMVAREGVVALDPTDGAVLWERGRASGPAGVPAIQGDLVLHARAEGVSGQVVARDLRTGELAWQSTLGSAVAGGPTISEGMAFVGTTGGELVALDMETGDEAWTFRTVGGVTGPPAVEDGMVVAAAYQASSGRPTLYGIDALAGPQEGPDWQLSPGAVGPPSAPAIEDRRVYLGISDLNVRAVALGSGTELWIERSRDAFAPRQVPAAGEALIVSDRTHLYRLDQATGAESWTYRLADLEPVSPGRVDTLFASSPAISGGTVLLGSGDGTLSAIDIDSGHLVWRKDLGEGAVGPVAVTSDLVYAVTLGQGGSVVALEHDPDGRLIDEVSPTVLFLEQALLNFALAAAAVGMAIVLLFRFALRPRTDRRS